MLPLADERVLDSQRAAVDRTESKRRLQGRGTAIGWLVAFTLLHGALYAALVPPWQAPDENVHYEYLRALWSAPGLFPAALERSPAVYAEVLDSFRRHRFWELVQAPAPAEGVVEPPYLQFAIRGGWSLYYRLSLPVYGLLQTAPIEVQLYALRLYSVGLQCLTVWLTFKLSGLIFARRTQPGDGLIPLAAAWVVALQPQYAFISASYNDDNLVPPLVAGALYALVRGLYQRADWRWLAAAGAATFLALLTKRTAVSLVVLWGVALVIYAVAWVRGTRPALRALGAAVLVGGVVAAALLVYGVVNPPHLPPSLVNLLAVPGGAWATLTGYLRDPAQLAQIAWVTPLLFLSVSFWGWFGWLKAPLSTPLMEALRRVTLLLILGCGVQLARDLWSRRKEPALRRRVGAILLAGLGLVLSLLVLVAQFLVGPPVYGLTGRYLFPFISAFGLLAVWGWRAWWPDRWKPAGLVVGLALLALVDVAALAFTIVPYFYG